MAAKLELVKAAAAANKKIGGGTLKEGVNGFKVKEFVWGDEVTVSEVEKGDEV